MPKFSSIAKHIFKCFSAKKYEELRADLVSYGLKQKQERDFFLLEGGPILDWAVSKTPEIDALFFLCKFIDRSAFREVLLSHNLNILDEFLSIQAGRESVGMDDEETAKSQLRKFKVLLSIAQKAVTAFMREKISSKCSSMTEKIKTNFETARRELSSSTKADEAKTVAKVGEAYHHSFVSAHTTFIRSLPTTKKRDEAKTEIAISQMHEPVSARNLAPSIQVYAYTQKKLSEKRTQPTNISVTSSDQEDTPPAKKRCSGKERATSSS